MINDNSKYILMKFIDLAVGGIEILTSQNFSTGQYP